MRQFLISGSPRRRRLLRTAGILATILAVSSFTAPTSAPIVENKYLETIKVTDDVYVFKPKIDWTHGNGVAILGPDGVVFIDTYIQFNYAEEAIRRLREVTKLPVRFVVNTHAHTDHVTGNAVFKRIFPQSHFIVQNAAIPNLEQFNRSYVEKQREQITGAIAQLDSEITSGKTVRGAPLVGSMKPFWDLQLREAKEYLASFHPEKFALPDMTFSDSLSMRWGNETLQLIHFREHGHSLGDVVVWIPEQRILVAGDIVVGPTPYATYQNIPGMVASIRRVLAMDPAIVIPGHGDVLHDLSYVHLLDTAFTAYREAAERAIAAKVPVQTAVDSISFPEIDQRFTGGDPTKAWAYRSFFSRGVVANMYRLAAKPASGAPANDGEHGLGGSHVALRYER